MIQIALVPPGQVLQWAAALIPYLRESESWTRGRASVDDIVRFVFNGQMQLWVVATPTEALGHIITEVKQYPRCKMLAIQYCAMKPGTAELVEDQMQDIAERFARDAGCVGIEFVGRPGWRNTARKYGYEAQSVTYQKFFGEPDHV